MPSIDPETIKQRQKRQQQQQRQKLRRTTRPDHNPAIQRASSDSHIIPGPSRSHPPVITLRQLQLPAEIPPPDLENRMSGGSEESLDAASKSVGAMSAQSLVINLNSEVLLVSGTYTPEIPSILQLQDEQGQREGPQQPSTENPIEDPNPGRPDPSTLSSTSPTEEKGSYYYPSPHKTTVRIRRKKMIVWILTFGFLLTLTGFSDVLHRLYWEKEELFSMALVKPWLTPILISELALTGIALLTILIKMKLIQGNCFRGFFQLVLVFNNFQYLAVFLALPAGTYLWSRALTSQMWLELHAHGHGAAGVTWNATQSIRHCCGVEDRHDWKMSVEWDGDIVPGEMLQFDDHFGTKDLFPLSCCILTDEHPKHFRCTEESKKYWTTGCREAELQVILEYVGTLLGLVLVAFVLSIAIRLRVDKLERYLTIFRPQEMF